MPSRREFLVGCSAAIAAMAGAKFGTLAFADGTEPSTDQILVFVFFRGGMDGLNFMAPVDDPNYVDARTPETIIHDSGPDAGLSLANGYSGFDFRLNSKGGAIKELYDSRQLALIHASGLTNGTRSHFEAQDLVDLGVDDIDLITYRSGWLDRLIQASHGEAGGIIPSVSMSGSIPKSYRGDVNAVSIPNPMGFAFVGNEDQQKAVEALYGNTGILGSAGTKTLGAISAVQSHIQHDHKKLAEPYRPLHGVSYPNRGIGKTLESLAQLIKMEVGLKFATVDYGGWDTHVQQNPHFGIQIDELGSALMSFWNDMKDYHDRLTLVTVSEFGRRVRANLSNGTDHGHGNCMMALGGHVQGGKMYGSWPGLATHQLDRGTDLAVTTDYRWVLAELCEKKYGIKNPADIFPNLGETKPVGIFA